MEAANMAQRSKHEYLRVMWQRYQCADRLTRSALLDEVTRACGYHPKYAIGIPEPPDGSSAFGAPGRPAHR